MSSHVFQENCREPLISLNKCEKLHRRKPLGQLLRVTKVEDEDDLFEFGGKYPGIVIGQEKCEGSHGLIPKYMGWLWNVQSLGISKLHQGPIPKPIKELLLNFLNPEIRKPRHSENDLDQNVETLTRNLDTKVSNDRKVLKSVQTQCNLKQDIDKEFTKTKIIEDKTLSEKKNTKSLPDKNLTKKKEIPKKTGLGGNFNETTKLYQGNESKSTTKAFNSKKEKALRDSNETKRFGHGDEKKDNLYGREKKKNLNSKKMEIKKPKPKSDRNGSKSQKDSIDSNLDKIPVSKNKSEKNRATKVVGRKTIKNFSRNSKNSNTEEKNSDFSEAHRTKALKKARTTLHKSAEIFNRPEPRQISGYFDKATTAQQPRNASDHCSPNYYKACQQKCSHVDISHRDALQAQAICNQIMEQNNCFCNWKF